MIRAVLDTNVVVSALISPFGNEARVLLEVLHGRVIPCLSAAIQEEYIGVLSRKKFGFAPADVNSSIESLCKNGLYLEAPPAKPMSPDPKDEPFIACALAAHADFLVTGNKRHFPEGCCGKTKIVSARELIQLLSTPQSP